MCMCMRACVNLTLVMFSVLFTFSHVFANVTNVMNVMNVTNVIKEI